jgi:hypothetical protein
MSLKIFRSASAIPVTARLLQRLLLPTSDTCLWPSLVMHVGPGPLLHCRAGALEEMRRLSCGPRLNTSNMRYSRWHRRMLQKGSYVSWSSLYRQTNQPLFDVSMILGVLDEVDHRLEASSCTMFWYNVLTYIIRVKFQKSKYTYDELFF